MRTPADHGYGMFRGNFNPIVQPREPRNPGSGFAPPPRNNTNPRVYVPKPVPQITVASPGIGPGLPSSYQPPNPFSGPF